MNEIWLTLIIMLIFLVNSYFCGKIIKRYSREINDFLALSFGFFIFFGGFQLFLLPIMIINITTNIFLYSFITYQSVLLILYIANWRFSLSPLFISKKQLFIVFIGTILILSIIYCFMNYTIDNQNYINDDLLNYKNNQYILNALIFSIGKVLNIYNYSIIYKHIFNLVFAIIISSGIFGMYFYDKENKFFQIITYLVILTILSVCSLSIFTSPCNGNSWILFSITLLIFNHIININNRNYKLGITNINFVSLGLFALCPNSLYVIILTNIYLLFMAFHYKFNDVIDYNIRGFFGCSLSICIFIKLNTSFIYIWIPIYLIIVLYILYYLIRNTKVMKPINNFFNNISINTIKFIMVIFAIIVFLIGMLIITIPGDFKFNSDPWVIKSFLNKELEYGTWLFWIVNIVYYIINILLVIYALLSYNNKKIQLYIENIRLSPLIYINTLTFWNPISTNFWLSISFNNVQSISNGFLSSFSTSFINFIYYLNNKNKWSKSLSIFVIGSILTTISLTLVNVLV